MTQKKRGSTMLKGAGAIAIIAFLLGMYTGIPGFSNGEGAKGSVGMPNANTASGPVEQAEDETKSGLVDDCVNVLIDGHDYLLQTANDGEKGYRKTTIEQVLTLAKDAKGTPTGIRVKVLCKASARASAEDQLRKALASSTIPGRSIFWPDGVAE